jgi:hypothetical protein
MSTEENLDVAPVPPLNLARHEMKKSEGSTATWTFLATAIFLHWKYSQFAWFTLPLLILGMFAAAVVIGSLFYLMKRVLIQIAMGGPTSSAKDRSMSVSGFILFVASIGVTIYLTRLAFRYVYGM